MKGISINDLHFGIADTKRLYEETVQIKDFIKSHDDLDILVINGDYFDCKLSLTDSASYYANLFFSELVKLVKEKHLIFRVIQGTRSHDLNQLQMFKPYESDLEMNFKIIETVQEEEINGIKILYVPEEYPEDANDYYREFKQNKYNIMFVHGTFDFVAQPGVIENANKSTHSAPVFFWKEWKPVLENGFVSAGHIHGRNTYSNKIYYSGSFSRWNFGERSEKGFTYFEVEPDSYKVKFINNTMAPIYDVISVSELDTDLEAATVEDIQTLLSEFINEKDHLRIDLGGLSKEKIETLKSYYKDMPNIKIEVKNKPQVILEQHTRQDFEKWHYITRRQLPLNKTIQKYCEEELSTKLDLAKIDEVLAKQE